MGKWDKFSFSSEEAAKLNDAANSLDDTTFEEIPDGQYEVAPISLELTESKKGFPMIKAVFEILAGQYEGRRIWVNQVVLTGGESDRFMLHNANTLLRGFDTGIDVVFTGMDDYEKLIDAIAQICVKFEYLLDKTTRKDFANYKLVERFDTGDEAEEAEDIAF